MKEINKTKYGDMDLIEMKYCFFVIFRIIFVYVHMCVPRRAHEGEPKG